MGPLVKTLGAPGYSRVLVVEKANEMKDQLRVGL